jgi:predicted transcriptional regulator
VFKTSNTIETGLHLGVLEQAVMNVMWRVGKACVNDVKRELGRPLAYTTVMTTLDRLFRKRLVAREKPDRAFIYSAAVSEQEFISRRTHAILHSLFTSSPHLPEVFISYLLDPQSEYDPRVLDMLEMKIKEARAAAHVRTEISAGKR